MQRSKNTSKWRRIRRLAWDRDRKARAVCHICGEKIDYSIPASSAPRAWEPDHLIPYAQNPNLELDLSNIGASHKECNRKRGNGTHDNEIGRRTRIW